MTNNAIPARFAAVYADGHNARDEGLALDAFPRGDPTAAYYWRLGWRGALPPQALPPEALAAPAAPPATLYLYPETSSPRPRRRSQAEVVAEKAKDRRAAAPYGALVARALGGKR